ncbi:MAG: hypothetical protein JXA30_00500 [Deltaproteobacteria bacterium]|nr:hypothetical protein [Deltaproteobacteria bacterium]
MNGEKTRKKDPVEEWTFSCLLLTAIVIINLGCESDSDQSQVPDNNSLGGTQQIVSGNGATASGGIPATETGSGASGSAVSGGGAPPSGGSGANGGTSGGGVGGSGGIAPGQSGGTGTAGTDSGTGGTGIAGTAGSDGGTSGSGGTDAVGGDGGTTTSTGPTLPEISDPGREGPFGVIVVNTASGLSTHSLFVPDDVGLNGKNPAVVWTCGNGGTTAIYASFLDHLASHGFLVVADKASTSDRMAEVASQESAVEWILAENAKQGGEFFERIDIDNIAVMGHSLGSLASFATAANNAHIATSIHYSGGLTNNPVGFDQSWLANMTKPAAFLCGGADGTAGPSCALDFEQAPPDLPVFYGVLAGATHIGPFMGTPRAGEYGRAGVAWLRWQLADDPAFESWFVGPNCVLCTIPWSAQQRNLP